MTDHTAAARFQDPAALEARFALRLTARLSGGSENLPNDITERLRFAREQAMARARTAQRAAVVVSPQGGALALIGGWWPRLAAAMPVLALAVGLVLVQMEQNDELARTSAEIDAALLADDLPPSAYTDAGFLEYLKAPAPLDR